MPFISVIVPNFNHAKFLEQRIQSVLNQTYHDFELILLDDCSTDNSFEILNKYKNHPKVSHLIINECNSNSPFMQWEKGISLAKGEFIWIAESDDYNTIWFLEKVVEISKSNKKAGLIYVKTDYIDTCNNVLPPDDYQIGLSKHFDSSNLYPGINYIRDYLIKQNTILNASALIFKKEIYNKCGSVDSTIHYSGDWLLYIKMLAFTDVFYIHEVHNYRRIHDKSHTFSLSDNWIDEHIKIRKAIQKYFKTPTLKNDAISSKNNLLLKELYGSKSISLAKRRKIFKTFQTLLKVSPKHFFEYLKHDLYWIKKGKYDK